MAGLTDRSDLTRYRRSVVRKNLVQFLEAQAASDAGANTAYNIIYRRILDE